jgi:hypothetical protein
MDIKWPVKESRTRSRDRCLWILYRRDIERGGPDGGRSSVGKFALRFGPPEYFSLIFLAFSILIYLASGSILKAIMMAAPVFSLERLERILLPVTHGSIMEA